MAYVFYNPNPAGKFTSDCVVRAIAKLMNFDWNTAYLNLSMSAFDTKSIISADEAWGEYLLDNGFKRYIIPDTCPRCYTVAQFANDNPRGRFLLKISGNTSGHVVAVVDGDYYDTWDCGGCVPIYYCERGK